MKLVFISHSAAIEAGAEQCLISLIKGIKRIHPDWQLFLIFPSGKEKPILDACEQYISGYKTLSMQWWLKNKKYNFIKKISFGYRITRKTIQICHYLQSIKPDYCITNTIVVPYLATASKIMRIPHLWFIHEIPQLADNQQFVFGYQKTYRTIDTLSYQVLVPSHYAKDFYGTYIDKNKIGTIKQSVEIRNLKSHDNKVVNKNSDNRTFNILLLGYFSEIKGQLDLLQAINILVKKNIEVKCIMVGSDAKDGTLQKCNDYIKNNNLFDNVQLRHCTNDVSNYYKDTDVLISCSRMETFGRTIIEAKLCKLPVIAANVGAVSESIQDGVDGLLYQAGNINELAAKIELLSKPSEREKLIGNIPTDLDKEYTPENFALEFCKYLKTAI